MQDFEPRPFQREIFEKISSDEKIKPLQWGRRRNYIGVDLGQPGGDKTVITHATVHKGRVFMYFDEYSEFPTYKWYRNPIKWYKWHQLWRKIRKSQYKAAWFNQAVRSKKK